LNPSGSPVIHAVIILSASPWLSSLAGAMLGQHPQLYGLPELHLFVADTLAQWHDDHTRCQNRPQAMHGLVRALAQLHEGEQSEASVRRAWSWLADRREWSIARIFEHLAAAVAPRILVEKSSTSAAQWDFLIRAYQTLPQANFLHLTTHPLAVAHALLEQREAPPPEGGGWLQQPLKAWLHRHNAILDFVSVLPEGQCVSLQGERLLAEDACYLPQIVQWLGIREDAEALEAMRHPEQSPYAKSGPVNARWGDDRKFLLSPTLRRPELSWPPLRDDPLLAQIADSELVGAVSELARQMGYG